MPDTDTVHETDRQPLTGALVVLRGGGSSGAVRLVNRRLVRLEPALRGTPAATAPGLLRALLPVCGWAQGIACRRAAEAAAGSAPNPATEAARERVLQGETAVSQVWRALIDWPSLLGREVQVSLIRDARKALETLVFALWQGDDPLAGTSPACSCAAADRAALRLAGMLDRVLDGHPEKPGDIAAWARTAEDACAVLMRRAARLVPPGERLPDAPPPAMAEIAAWLVENPGFGARPHWQGAACDIGPGTALEPAQRKACDRFGPVAARYAAMVLDMRRTAAALRAPVPLPQSMAPVPGAPGWGAGLAATSRGPLVHVLRLEGGRIAGFRSVAPTEWLLHPGGALQHCLSALAGDVQEADIRLVLGAFDPCAPVVFRHENAPVGAPAHA